MPRDFEGRGAWVDPKKWSAGGYVIKMRQDPWGFDYAYACPSPDGKPFLVQTNGAYGAAGGTGPDADLSCWD